MPKMLGLDGQEVHQSSYGWSPVYVQDNLGVMSIGFLLPNPDDAVIWRGPRKNGIIKQFLKDTYWGDDEMDVLIVDAPPGTSDEHISIVQLLQGCRPGTSPQLAMPEKRRASWFLECLPTILASYCIRRMQNHHGRVGSRMPEPLAHPQPEAQLD